MFYTMNCKPLSMTTYSGNLYAVKSFLSLSIVLLAVTPGISIICGHLDWASTISRNIFERGQQTPRECVPMVYLAITTDAMEKYTVHSYLTVMVGKLVLKPQYLDPCGCTNNIMIALGTSSLVFQGELGATLLEPFLVISVEQLHVHLTLYTHLQYTVYLNDSNMALDNSLLVQATQSWYNGKPC